MKSIIIHPKFFGKLEQINFIHCKNDVMEPRLIVNYCNHCAVTWKCLPGRTDQESSANQYDDIFNANLLILENWFNGVEWS